MNDLDVTILRCNGTEEQHTVPRADLRNRLRVLLQCAGFAFVKLRDGNTMWVDDTGLIAGLPANPQATALYHSVCVPGTTQPIAGDVALVPTEPWKP